MFYKYEILNNGVEDILYLYLSMSYEFSKELGKRASNEDLARRTKNFIDNNHIDFKGNKVYLIIDGIVVRTVNIKENNKITNIRKNINYSDEFFLVTVKLEDNSLVEITLKEYLLGVLATTYIPFMESETIKALSILYRTYAYKMMADKHSIDAFSNFALFLD